MCSFLSDLLRWFGRGLLTRLSSATAGLPVPDRWRVTWRPSWRLPALPGSCSSSSSRRSCGTWQRLRLGDEALRALERELIDSPDKAPVIEQTGGLRKLRFAPPGSGRGRSGAYRVCYAYFPAYGTVALFVIFGKNERSDLSPAEARATAKALKAFEAELHREFEQQT